MRWTHAAAHLLFLAALCQALPALAAEKQIGTTCTGDANAADWDTIAQCSSGTFVRANPFLANTEGIGIGSAIPMSVLDIGGGVSIGTAYAGITAAPASGAIIQGTVGIGTTSPTYDLSFGGNVAREIWMERNSSGAGNNLTIQAGGAQAGVTDTAGGNLVLSSGIATGTQTSSILFQTASGTTTGTSSVVPTTAMTLTQTSAGGIFSSYLGIGTAAATPYVINAVSNNSNSGTGFRFQNNYSGTSASANIIAANNAGVSINLIALSSAYNNYYSNVIGTGGTGVISSASGGLTVGDIAATGYLTFVTAGTTTTNIRAKIDQNGVLGIGTTTMSSSNTSSH
jgi:hypothetical protein